MADLDKLKTAVKEWKETVEWIARGWDCIEEYEHDLTFREGLQEVLDEFVLENAPPKEIIDEIKTIDDQFISVTEASNLSVWDCGPKFRYYDEDHIEILPINEYDRYTYWYYYRWQPNCPYSWKGADAVSYQKDISGLDFANMSQDELIEAVKQVVARWEAEIKQQRRQQSNPDQ
jgi:hypothetical protein